ncbi:hypothetical protein DBY21_09885 [Candidatus Gastranaerophilales bacterium]|nr:MAG: hypothetical protein DBY21_09885 [Candidatus Gastranaerophilales bacterium]
MDLTTGLIIFGIVLAISLIVRIFFAITKILVTILIIAAIVIGIFIWQKDNIKNLQNKFVSAAEIVEII